MTTPPQVTIITETRNDAIGIYNEGLVPQLLDHSPGLRHLQLNNRVYRKRLVNTALSVWNTAKLSATLPSDHVLFFTDPITIKAQAAFFLRNKKVLVVHHVPEEEPSYYRRLPYFNLKKLFRRFCTIICDSEFTRLQVAKLAVPSQQVMVVHCGLDHDLFKPTEKRIPDIDYPFILHVGTEAPRKNMAGLLEAFLLLKQDFPALKLIRLGHPGKPAYRRSTLECIKRLGIESEINLAGEIPRADLPTYYSQAELLLFPSLLEGFGMPVVEAMACGCPVVTSDRGSLKELVGNTQIIANPADPADIAARCRMVLEDKTQRDRMAKAGIKQAGEFTWSKTADAVFQVLSGI